MARPRASFARNPGTLHVLVVLVALSAPALAGCLTFKPDPVPALQPGDFAVVHLVREVRGPGGDVERTVLDGARLYLGDPLPQDPEAFPDGWDLNTTRTAVPGLIDALDGAAEGETRETGWLAPSEAYGEHDPNWVDVFGRTASLPRTVQNATVADDGTAVAYGRTWNATPVDADGDGAEDDAYLEVADEEVAGPGDAPGALVEHPDFGGPDGRMWLSELVATNDTHLTVRHVVEEGAVVERGSVEGRVTTVNASAVVVDRNHPLAGKEVRFEATLVEIVFTRPGRVRAPDFAVQTLDDGTFRLSDQRGTPVLLYFFATWCSVCKVQTPEALALQERLGANVTVLAVSVDPNERPETVRDYRDDHVERAGGAGTEVAFAIDDRRSRVGSTYTVITIPKMVLVDADGFLTWTGQGHVTADAMAERVEAAPGD